LAAQRPGGSAAAVLKPGRLEPLPRAPAPAAGRCSRELDNATLHLAIPVNDTVSELLRIHIA